MAIRLMVDRSTYSALRERGEVANGCAMNDFVSTTRHDPTRKSHEYESRRSLVRSAVRGSGARGVSVRVFDDIHTGRPLVASLVSVGPLLDDGLRFMVALSRGGIA